MMAFQNSYKSLTEQIYTKGEYSIVPIRYKDRFEIMKWRNDQIDILRQNTVLTKKDQNNYFDTVIKNLFDQKRPSQLLFSFLHNNNLIGYGGLVHLDWKNKNAEISFLLDSELSSEGYYLQTFDVFLKLIEKVAHNIRLHKIFTYGYCLHNYRFQPLISNGYNLEARLKDHVLINTKLTDVKIYSRII